eukprot:TRINITY_DN34307_c0_g1_i1.p2 TRINITY_DN34307_c0_g1~~TRINITY_DN34307_c0_g1_i1.p2  ORF type:complete len:143 (+),score=25.22 TRINITY_DN34307_c0_g1_i1:676-1104(+)
MNWHHQGVAPSMYKSDPKIASTFKILSTNLDVDGKEFISSIEGIDLPFYGTQFHPEWSIFEWDPTAHVSHSYDAISAMSYLSRFFVKESQRNDHAFPSPSLEAASLIYNYKPTYTGITGGDEQTVIFSFIFLLSSLSGVSLH